MIDLEALNKEYEDEYLRFDRISQKLSNRPDLHAFLLLDKLIPGDRDIISGAEHDEFYLSIDCEDLSGVITEAEAIDLIRCGVMFTDGYLSMFS